jgi:glycosyltransferase involved in cell wall biosynthesis
MVKSLLELGCFVTVWCCQPWQHHDKEQQQSESHHHLQYPEIDLDAYHRRLTLIPLVLREEDGWRKLDQESAWEYFAFSNLDQNSQKLLLYDVSQADAMLVIDWTGAQALRSLFEYLPPKLAIVYLNFRVYSSGIGNVDEHAWYDAMEVQALDMASAIIVLSNRDHESLQNIAKSKGLNPKHMHILLPPLRSDIATLAQQPSRDLAHFLPATLVPDMPENKPWKYLVVCVVRLSHEKQVMRFVRFIEKIRHVLDEFGYIPLLAGAASEEIYAEQVRNELRRVAPNSIIVQEFLSPSTLVAIFSRSVLNFHPCNYDAYGMTIIEAAACGVPSIVAKNASVGAWALLQSEACIEIEMPKHENDISNRDVTSVASLLRNPDMLETIARKAQTKALEWDENVYGKRLFQIICETTEKVKST